MNRIKSDKNAFDYPVNLVNPVQGFSPAVWQLANLKSLTIDVDEGNAVQIKQADMAEFSPV